MNKQIEIEDMAKIIAQSVDEETLCDGLAGDSSMACLVCDYSEKEYCKHHLESATGLYNKGYRKAEDIAFEATDNFRDAIMDVFIDMCGENDYNKLTLWQIGDAIDDVYDNQIAELKKKYESEGENSE